MYKGPISKAELERAVDLAADGATLAEIGAVLGRDPGTISEHRQLGQIALNAGTPPDPAVNLDAWFADAFDRATRETGLGKAIQVHFEGLSSHDEKIRTNTAYQMRRLHQPQRLEVAGDPRAPLHHVDETDWARLTDEEVDRLEELREKMSGGSES